MNTFEEALRQYPRHNHRHRIEHAGLAMPDLIERMAKLGIVTVPNPNFFTEFGDIYIKHFGARSDYFYPIGACLKAGIVVAGASDSPVSNCNPLIGIHGAVNRLTPSGAVIGEEQKISVIEGIRLYTQRSLRKLRGRPKRKHRGREISRFDCAKQPNIGCNNRQY